MFASPIPEQTDHLDIGIQKYKQTYKRINKLTPVTILTDGRIVWSWVGGVSSNIIVASPTKQ